MSTPAKNKGHRVAIAVSGLLSLAILIILGLRLDWTVLLEQLGRVHWPYLLLLVVVTLATVWIRALRWRHLLPDGSVVSRMALFEATMVGHTANFILPLRVGEVIRPWILSRSEPVRFSSGFASIVVERVFDLLTLLALLGVTLAKLDTMPPLVSAGAKMLSILTVIILALMVSAYLGSNRMIRFGEGCILFILGKRAPRLADKLVNMIEGFIAGLRGVSSLKDLVWSIFWSAMLWAMVVLLYQIGLWSFGVTPSIWVGVTVCVMIALAVAAPGAPGFIGTFQLGCVVGLGIFSYTEEFSVAYSIVLHAIQAATFVVWGFIILHRRGLSLTDVSKQAKSRTSL